MAKTTQAPGRSNREGITLIEAVKRFSDEDAAEQWLIEARWPNGITCPQCGNSDVAVRKLTQGHKRRYWRCRKLTARGSRPATGCNKTFSVLVGTVMQNTKLSLSDWCIALYLASTNLKGVSSVKLHRDLSITQKSDWYLGHRIRKAYTQETVNFQGPAEVDETHIGGSNKNKPKYKQDYIGGGPSGKAVVVGIKDCDTNLVHAAQLPDRRGATVKPFVTTNTQPGAPVITDDSRVYSGLTRTREVVNHSIGGYVKGVAHTNGIESFWAMLKRAYMGVFHHFPEKHLGRYVGEFAVRHNVRPLDTIDQMTALVRWGDGKRLTYQHLVGPKHIREPALLKGW